MRKLIAALSLGLLIAGLALLPGAGTVAAEDTLPTVSVSDAEAYEDSSWITFEVTLSHPSPHEVRVEYVPSSGTATSGTDFEDGRSPVLGKLSWLTFPPNTREPQHASVRLIDDQELEPDETFTLTLTNPTGATLGDATATGTIKNEDTAATLTASIGVTTATLTLSGHTQGWWYEEVSSNAHPCTAVPAGTTTVSLSGLKAAVDYDYRAYSKSGCKTENGKLAGVWFKTLSPEGTPTLSVSDLKQVESDVWMTFEVSLSAPSRHEVTVGFVTSDGTATSGTDFRAESSELWRLTFPPNSREPQRVPVLVYNDSEVEPDETFTLTLLNPTGATLGDATATATIKDNDGTATLTASGVKDTTATLTIRGHTQDWWYKGEAHQCTAVPAGTTTVGIGGLTAATHYVYGAYSESTCATVMDYVAFETLAAEDDETPEPLTASFHDVPAEHGGREFSFELRFSENFPGRLDYRKLKEEALQALNGPGAGMLDVYNDMLGDLGLHAVGIIPTDFGSVVIRKGVGKLPMNYPDEPAGMKIRVPGLSIAVDRFNNLGFAAVPIPLSEVHTALQLGTVDARSFSTAVETYTLRDVLEANILTNDYFEVAFWLVNKSWWDGLDDDVRNTLQAAADATIAWSWEEAERKSNEFLQKARDAGINVVDLSDEQMSAAKRIVYEKEWPAMEAVVGKDTMDRIRSVVGVQ